jgi:hypothetical protein
LVGRQQRGIGPIDLKGIPQHFGSIESNEKERTRNTRGDEVDAAQVRDRRNA